VKWFSGSCGTLITVPFTMKRKISGLVRMINGVMMDWKEDKPFGPPPEEYNCRCSHCNCEVPVNEAIIDFDLGFAEFEGRNYEGYMPVLGCPGCNRETLRYAGVKSPPEGR
jgi:hypothetical protein